MYALHLNLAGKPMINFLFVALELFCYLLRLRCHKRKSVKVGVDGRAHRPQATVGVRKLE